MARCDVTANGSITVRSDTVRVSIRKAVEGRNNPPSFFEIVPENAVAGDLIRVPLAVVDPDTGQTHTFEILMGPPGAEIVEDTIFQWRSGEVATQYEVTIAVRDNGQPPAADTGRFTIVISQKPIESYNIVLSAGPNGAIVHEGSGDTVIIEAGLDISFTIRPDEGYHIAEVLVDNQPDADAAANGVYQFKEIGANHTLAATFAIDQCTLAVAALSGKWQYKSERNTIL